MNIRFLELTDERIKIAESLYSNHPMVIDGIETLKVYKKHAHDFEEMYKQEHREKNKFKRQVEEMQKTLEWYADAANYSYQFYIGDIEDNELETPIEQDDGERARQALKGETK